MTWFGRCRWCGVRMRWWRLLRRYCETCRSRLFWNVTVHLLQKREMTIPGCRVGSHE